MSKWNPDDHLPECGVTRYPICICDRLRACEKRVTERWESLRGWGESYAYKTGSDNGFDVGYVAGLDAAREAVKHLRHSDDCYYAEGVLCHCEIKFALAAIDALREKP